MDDIKIKTEDMNDSTAAITKLEKESNHFLHQDYKSGMRKST